jgi:hypothetical protein
MPSSTTSPSPDPEEEAQAEERPKKRRKARPQLSCNGQSHLVFTPVLFTVFQSSIGLNLNLDLTTYYTWKNRPDPIHILSIIPDRIYEI